MLWVGEQRITSMAASTTLTVPGTGDGRANCAMVIAEDQDVRIRRDGTAPTAAVGLLLPAGVPVWLFDDLSNVKVIETAASASFFVQYYKR